PDLYAAYADTLAQQWYAEHCSVPEPTCESTSFRKLLDFLLKISHMNQPPLQHRTACHRASDRRQRKLSDRTGGHRGMVGDETQRLAVHTEDSAVGRTA